MEIKSSKPKSATQNLVRGAELSKPNDTTLSSESTADVFVEAGKRALLGAILGGATYSISGGSVAGSTGFLATVGGVSGAYSGYFRPLDGKDGLTPAQEVFSNVLVEGSVNATIRAFDGAFISIVGNAIGHGVYGHIGAGALLGLLRKA